MAITLDSNIACLRADCSLTLSSAGQFEMLDAQRSSIAVDSLNTQRKLAALALGNLDAGLSEIGIVLTCIAEIAKQAAGASAPRLSAIGLRG
jgi:hypothetical protein